MNLTDAAVLNIALPAALANGRYTLLPGYNRDQLVVRFNNPDVTWPTLDARKLRQQPRHLDARVRLRPESVTSRNGLMDCVEQHPI